MPSGSVPSPAVLWAPSDDARTSTRLGRFLTFCEERSGRTFEDYDELWRWSVGDGLEECWAAIWDFFAIEADERYREVLDRRVMPGADWFPGARLNYARHILRWADDDPDRVAIVGCSQSRDRIEMTWGELAEQVARARRGLEGNFLFRAESVQIRDPMDGHRGRNPQRQHAASAGSPDR